MTELEAPGPVRFTSELSAERSSQLEELLFFNENQTQYRSVVIDSIERFGVPAIRNDRGLLRLHTSELGEVQSLFAVEHGLDAQRPVAVAVYARTTADTVTLLHLAIHRDFASDGPFAKEMVTLKLVREVVGAVSRIKDIRKVELLYGAAERATIPVRVGAGRRT